MWLLAVILLVALMIPIAAILADSPLGRSIARRLEGLDGGRIGRTLLQIVLASAAMGVAAYYAEAELHHLLPAARLVPRLVRVGGGIGAGLGTLVLAAWLLRIEEFQQAMGRLLKRT